MRNAELLREAHAASRARDEFLGTAAHELRTPLASAMLQLEAAERAIRAGRTEDAARRLEKSRLAGRRLSDLIDRLLEFAARLEGKRAVRFEQVDLRIIAESVIDRVSPISEQAGSTLSLRVSGRTDGVFAAEELDAVLANLLGNALRYAPTKPIEVELDGAAAEVVVVTVTDHGPGIDPAARERLFERYERGVSAIEQPGFGLGLAIVRDAVRAHGGTIDVDRGEDGGARFRIALPRHPG